MMADNERRLITIASGKGGVGKTWFAITLAHALARRGRRVLLFDGDLGLANVDIQLGLTPAHDLGDVLDGRMAIHEAAAPVPLDGTPSPGRLDVLAGKSGSGLLAGLETGALLALRQRLIDAAGRYDRVLLDLAAGIEPGVTLLSQHRGTVLVVLTPDPTSLTDAYAYIKVLHQRRPDADIRVVVNMAKNRKEGERTWQALRKVCQTFLRHDPELAGIIPDDRRVREAIRMQAPLLSRFPQSEAGEAVQALAETLLAAEPAPA
ncbi:MAG: site-determining protein [Rhodothalassiaceae bacterium]|nr:MAG: site-determining protein [Rhodothalassiaceae bacterium]